MTFRKKLIMRKHRVKAEKEEEKRKAAKPAASGRTAVSFPQAA
jgi:hypothetical protein